MHVSEEDAVMHCAGTLHAIGNDTRRQSIKPECLRATYIQDVEAYMRHAQINEVHGEKLMTINHRAYLPCVLLGL